MAITEIFDNAKQSINDLTKVKIRLQTLLGESTKDNYKPLQDDLDLVQDCINEFALIVHHIRYN